MGKGINTYKWGVIFKWPQYIFSAWKQNLLGFSVLSYQLLGVKSQIYHKKCRHIEIKFMFIYNSCITLDKNVHCIVVIYSQARWSVPTEKYINEFIIRKLNPLLVVDFRLISTFLHVCCEFTCKAVMKFLPAQFSWIWCKCLLRNLIHSKIFNLTKYREILVKYSLLITHAGMPLWIWHQLRERLTDSFFK